MAFRFMCPECGGEIVVLYLKRGEIAACPHCSAKVAVPETAEEFDHKSPPASTPPVATTSAVPPRDDFGRPVERAAVLVLKIVAWVGLVACVIVGIAMAAVGTDFEVGPWGGLLIALYGVLIWAALLVWCSIAENLMAIRKNTEGLSKLQFTAKQGEDRPA